MKHLEFPLLASDGLQLFGQSWSPAARPRGVLCLVHGYGEHSGRYGHVAASLVEAGYAVVAFDQRGHGKSAGPRGYTPGYEQSLDDVDRLLAAGQERFSGRPTFLYGHSMGGNMVLNFVLRRRPELVGVIASSPWLRLYEPPPRHLMLASRLIGAVYHRFSIDQGAYEGGVLSRDPEMDAAFEPDPYTHGIMSNKLFTAVSAAADWALAHAAQFPLPLLIQHGTGDTLIDFSATQTFAQRSPAARTTFKGWDGYYHELHNDLGREAVIRFVVAWLDGRLAELAADS